MSTDSNSPGESSHSADATTTGNSRPGRLVPPPWFWLLIVVLVVAIVIFQKWAPLGHRASENMATGILIFLTGLVSIGWFSFSSGYPKLMRTVAWISVICTLLIAALLFRVEYLSGNLIPTLTPRWTPSADQILELPDEGPRTAQLDTSTPQKDFPQFLGPDRNQRVDGVQLARSWDQSPPVVVWRQPIGAGWSSFSAAAGLAVTMEQRDKTEMVTCYQVKTGELVWWHGVAGRHRTIQGGAGPRSTPTIHDGKVYAVGANGWLHCLNASTGGLIWERNLLDEFGLTLEQDRRNVVWGRSGSPLIVDETVVVPAGGPSDDPVSLVAYDKNTGIERWRGGNRQISYSSPALATIAGQRQILIVNEGSATGHDPATGAVLWETDWPGHSDFDASTSQATPLGDDRVLLSKGYSGGAKVIRPVSKGGAGWDVEMEWSNNRLLKTKLTNVVLWNGHIYGLSDGILECVQIESGERQWKRGRYQHGQMLGVGDVLLILTEQGELVMVDATPERHRQLASIQVLRGQTWNNLCLYGDLLLVRNAQEAACYRLPLEQGNTP